MSEATQRMATAPMMAVPSCPRMPPQVMPSCPNSHPPTRPPNKPSTRFMMNPKPPPFINLPAQKPARHPIMIEPIIPISICFNLSLTLQRYNLFLGKTHNLPILTCFTEVSSFASPDYLIPCYPFKSFWISGKTVQSSLLCGQSVWMPNDWATLTLVSLSSMKRVSSGRAC